MSWRKLYSAQFAICPWQDPSDSPRFFRLFVVWNVMWCWMLDLFWSLKFLMMLVSWYVSNFEMFCYAACLTCFEGWNVLWCWILGSFQTLKCRVLLAYLIFVIYFTPAGFLNPNILHPKSTKNTQKLQQIAPKSAKYAFVCIQSGKFYTGQNCFTQAPPVVPVTNMRYGC